MAVFANLHHVGEVLVQMIEDNLPAAPTGTVQVGPPLETATGAAEDIRLTLLWVTPQPTHRNDRWERKPDGGLLPPPITLSAFYMITTYGSASDDPIRAHELLGNVMQVFHSEPELQLPLAALPDAGDGPLTVVQVPTAADLLEKVYAPLQLKHRPWVLFEVGPIQLPHQSADRPPAPVVRPGGINFGEVEVLGRPQVLRVTPAQQGQGGRVRVDLELRGRTLENLVIEGIATPLASLTPLVAGQSYVLTLPNTLPNVVAPGGRSLRAEVGSVMDPPRQFSQRATLTVLDPSTPTLDAPNVATHSLAGPLSLSGRELAATEELLFWPDAELSVPTQIKSVLGPSATPTSVVATAAELATAGLTPGTWRISARVGDHVYTPYVLLELTA